LTEEQGVYGCRRQVPTANSQLSTINYLPAIPEIAQADAYL
jgi:hypothetical protein